MNSLAKKSLTPAWMAVSMRSFWDAKVVAPAGRQHRRASWLVKAERREVGEEKSVGRVRMVLEEEEVGGGM